MQELVLETTCDYCFAEREEKAQATEVIALVDTGEVYVIDLCSKDQAEWSVSELAAYAKEYGRPLYERRNTLEAQKPAKPVKKRVRKHDSRKDPPPGGGTLSCPYPGCKTESKNPASLSSHFVQQHGERLATWRARQAGEELFYCSCGDAFSLSRARSNHITASKTGDHHAVSGSST